MNIQLIQGEFDTRDALDLIAQMLQVKISYHETKILTSNHEEDIKRRESRIKALQNALYDVRNQVSSAQGNIKLNAEINIER
mgnify:CR=1 FL=1